MARNLENNLAIALLSHVEDTEEEEKMRSHGGDFLGDAFGGLRLRFFNEPQRHREHRGRKEKRRSRLL